MHMHMHAWTRVINLSGVPKHMTGTPYYYYDWDPGAPFPRGPQNFMTLVLLSASQLSIHKFQVCSSVFFKLACMTFLDVLVYCLH